MAADANEDMGKVLTDPRFQGKGFLRLCARLCRGGVKAEIPVDRSHQAMQESEPVFSNEFRPTKRRAIVHHRSISHRQVCLAQKQRLRKALNRAGDNAVHVGCLDNAFDQNRNLFDRGDQRKAMDNIAESIVTRHKAAIMVDINAPIHDILAIAGARRHAQHLHHRQRRTVIVIAGLVMDRDTHGAPYQAR